MNIHYRGFSSVLILIIVAVLAVVGLGVLSKNVTHQTATINPGSQKEFGVSDHQVIIDDLERKSSKELKVQILAEGKVLENQQESNSVDKKLAFTEFAAIESYFGKVKEDPEVEAILSTLSVVLGACWSNTGLYHECAASTH